jgi:hypothetical protein
MLGGGILKYKARDYRFLIFSIAVCGIVIINIFSETITSTYWMIIGILSVLFFWLLLKATKDKIVLSLSVLAMLIGTIVIKLQQNELIIFLGTAMYLIALFFFVFEKSK